MSESTCGCGWGAHPVDVVNHVACVSFNSNNHNQYISCVKQTFLNVDVDVKKHENESDKE